MRGCYRNRCPYTRSRSSPERASAAASGRRSASRAWRSTTPTFSGHGRIRSHSTPPVIPNFITALMDGRRPREFRDGDQSRESSPTLGTSSRATCLRWPPRGRRQGGREGARPSHAGSNRPNRNAPCDCLPVQGLPDDRGPEPALGRQIGLPVAGAVGETSWLVMPTKSRGRRASADAAASREMHRAARGDLANGSVKVQIREIQGRRTRGLNLDRTSRRIPDK
jgi:hypothetical protein